MKGSPRFESPLLSIYDGQTCIGFILNRGQQGWEAFDAGDASLGLYPSQRDATNAIITGGGST
jgi:hypothetical protein